MKNKTFTFTKEMAKLFTKLRKKAGLSQTEVAVRIGLSRKSYPYISYLESGKIKNPTLANIVLYVRACGGSLPEFFKELDIIDFKQRHEKMIAQLPVPPIERKIQRDAMKYEINIEFPSKEKEEIDFDRLKKIIKDKVIALVNKEEATLTSFLSHPGRGEEEDTLSPNRVSRPEKGRFDHQGKGGDRVITAYQKFALEYFDFLASLNKAGMKMITDKYQRAGLHLHLISRIKKIINSVLRAEIKRISTKKPLPTEKQEKMAIRFTKYRIIIEQIEAEVHKLLCASAVPTPLFALYKGYTRECYKALKKYYGKDEELLKQTLAKIIRPWQKQGLKQEILLKVQERVIKTFGSLRMKRMV